MRVGIIQARMTSTRLPGKVLMPIHGVKSLERMIGRVRKAQNLEKLVVATTENTTDDPVVALCESIGVSVFRGDEDDVLLRFRQTAEHYGAKTVVRLTADCPMLDPQVLDQIIEGFLSGDWDYYSNTRDRTYPDGLDCEAFTLEALLRASEEAQGSGEREHVTPFINSENGFKVGQLTYLADFSHVRWTLDTARDFAVISKLVSLVSDDYHWLEVLAIATRYPELLGLPQDMLEGSILEQGYALPE